MEATNVEIPSILRRIDGVNNHKKIKLRYKKTANQGYSLYLDLWLDGKRRYEFLKLYIVGTKASLAQDKETLRIAQSLRDKKEIELLQQRTGFKLSDYKSKANFIEYFQSLVAKKNHHNWRSCQKHLVDMAGHSLTFKQLNRKFCEEFKDYLLSKVDNNTAQSYFAKFKVALNTAVKEDILSESPANGITIPKRETTREFLTTDEIKMAIATPAADIEVKNAFLFSCYTGLRISDIRELTFERIREGYLSFRQMKTKGVERMKLHPQALEVVERQKALRSKSEDDKVFLLPLDSGTLNKVVRNWMKAAGVKKKVTYHCSRHTFATLCLTYDVDIYTVSKLLGHRDLKTTEIYAKLIDKKKDEAIEKLPKL